MLHQRTNTSSNAHYSQVPSIQQPRNGFSISQKHVTTIQFDQLFPIYTKYIYPGDTINIFNSAVARLGTQSYLLYDDLYIDLHAWFVPMRLIQTNWARYQFNAQPAGPSQDNSALTSPKITLSGLGAGGFVAKSLYDYFGFPTEVNLSADTQHINNYLARAYNLIWNENYRDENLQNPAVVDLDDGPDNPADYVLLKRGRRHDKFTSMLTAAQKGTPVSLPLGTSAPIKGIAIGGAKTWQSGTASNAIEVGTGTSVNYTGYYATDGAGPLLVTAPTIGQPRAYADLAAATAATLNQVRQSYAVQHLLEADARGGTRDVESIQHRWGVTVPDFRLQRPEYLGGSTQTFDGVLVPQSSGTASGTTPQGNLTQFSQAQPGLGVTHSFSEHGIFMILISCRSNMTYQEGLRRELSYRTRYDWYQPEFANLGEVAVLNKEWYMQGTSADDQTAGYQEYAYELRYGDNMVTGEMRSNYATSRDGRVMADDYSSLPTLGSTFIQSNTPISRNLAVSTSTADPIELNNLTAGMIARTLPMFSIPGLKRL